MNTNVTKADGAAACNVASAYESPTLLDLGGVAALTLGTAGHDRDNCGCSLPNDQISLF